MALFSQLNISLHQFVQKWIVIESSRDISLIVSSKPGGGNQPTFFSMNELIKQNHFWNGSQFYCEVLEDGESNNNLIYEY